MTFDVGKFRVSFPEFSDTVAYPDTMIDFWGGLAVIQVLPCIWKSAWVQGASLYVAHRITIAAQNRKLAEAGGMPGTSGGIANTKTVGSVTVGYDSQSTSDDRVGAAYWNLTTYGKDFWNLAMIFGTGAIQL